MQFRFTAKTLLGATAMVTMGASLVAAQSGPVKPKSTTRIPISKDAPGEVARTKTDTARTKTDTVTLYKTDTVRVTTQLQGRVDTVRTTQYKTDTVTVAPMAPPIRLPGGMYFGIGGGVTAPNGSLYNPNSAGPSAQLQLGWQGAKNLLGVRGDINYTKPGEDSQYSALQADPEVLNFSADAKLNVPFLTHMFGATHRFGIYGIGGYTHTMYKNLPIRVSSGGTDVIAGLPIERGQNDWTHKNGWNAGGGASLGWGRTEVFFETRVLAFSGDNIPQARQMPFVLGLNFY
jgi:hypothetical protein